MSYKKVCKCGCNKEFVSKNINTQYINHHFKRTITKNFMPVADISEIKYCACGCKQKIKWRKIFRYTGWGKYINNHYDKTIKGKSVEERYTDIIKIQNSHKKKPDGFGDNIRQRQLGRTMQERLNLTKEEYEKIRRKQIIAASRPYHIKFGHKADIIKEKRKLARVGRTYKDLFGENEALRISKQKSEAYPEWGKSWYEEPIIRILEDFLSFKIDRNFWIKISNTNKRYKIDGYIHELGLAIEIDEPYHNTVGQVLKDKKREEEIKYEIPYCKFLRLKISQHI